MDSYSIKNTMVTSNNKKYVEIVDKIISLGSNKSINNNVNELIERDYYSKFMNKPVKPLSIYEKEILNNYSNILYSTSR
jgi:hypothetical protein